MSSIILGHRLYGPFLNKSFNYFEKEIHEIFSELELSYKIELLDDGRLKINISGDDMEFAINLLKQKYGECIPSNSLKIGNKFFGNLIDVGKHGFGLYVRPCYCDAFSKDSLLPLYSLRNHFFNESLRKIIFKLGLIENQIVEVIITDLDYKLDNPNKPYKITVDFTKRQIDIFKSWLNANHDRIIISGALLNDVRYALIKSNHLSDILKIKSPWILEHILVIKKTSNATGILSAIGKFLKRVPIGIVLRNK